MARSSIWVAIWLTVVVVASPVRADPPPSSEYTQRVNEALAEFEMNHFEEAREQFKRAHELYPNARTLRGLGMVEFELRHYQISIRFLEQALESTVKPLSDSLRAETQDLLGRARGYVGELRVAVEPPGASVSIDGLPVDVAEAPTLMLEVGDHHLDVRATGYMGQTRRITVEGNSHQELELRLELLPTEPEPAPAVALTPHEPAARVDAAKKRRLTWLWVSLGVLVVGAGVTTAVLLTRDDDTQERTVDTANTPPGLDLHAARF
jgi:tetratricopeptide (TPR) repeat protein